jgi:L-fucose isomerase-like protein
MTNSHMAPATQTPVLGVIHGNRDFFPDHLVTEARADVTRLFGRLGIRAVQLG